MSKPLFLLTGGSRGIGAAIARAAARDGYRVLLTYAGRKDDADAVVAGITAAGGTAAAIQADTARAADIDALFTAADRIGGLKVACYNGGITGPSSPLVEADNETLARVVDINLTGALIFCREAVRRLSTRRGGSGGSIVLMSSRATFYGAPGDHVWYAASKGGIDSLTYGLAREVGAEGIRVNAVSPGPIKTEIHAPGRLDRISASLPMQRAGEPEEVASAVLYLASDAASYISGSVLNVAGAR